jgi:cobalt-zinc-cadmium efflux system membrane fusion protein
MKNALILAALAAALASCARTKPEARAEPEPKAGSGLITMERTAQTRVGLEVAPARTTQLNEYLQVTGTVQPVDSRVGQVRPPARGRLLEVRAKVGDRVRAGQELARLDNLEAVELAAQVAAARAELDRARVLLASQTRQAERNRKLSAIGAAPRKDYEQSDAERRAMEAGVRSQEAAVAGLIARLRRFGGGEPDPAAAIVTAIAAPFGGIVTKAAATPGALVDSAVELFTVADIAEVWVQAEVYEKDLGRLQVGQSARVRVDTYPNEPFTGRVAYISDALDPQTRTAKVRCVVGNAGARLKLDMFATVELPTTFRRRAVAVPVGAIQQLESKTVVFVQRGPTRFEAREITTGGTVDGVVEVLAGLKDGEPIVTVGSFHLKSIVAGKDLGEE